MIAPRRIPQERLAAIATVARATREGLMLVLSRGAVMRRQYRWGARRHGSLVENLHFTAVPSGRP